jgi:hypothetical protein
MKLWVDDLRTPPDDSWTWVKNPYDAIQELAMSKMMSEGKLGGVCSMGLVTHLSLDHDLGPNPHGGDPITSRPIVLWMCEKEWWPANVVVHSANPVGVEWLEGMIERYKI